MSIVGQTRWRGRMWTVVFALLLGLNPNSLAYMDVVDHLPLPITSLHFGTDIELQKLVHRYQNNSIQISKSS
ncbi:hypothetical protein FPQ18DRAFT_169340 [Pyronema domesticum]|nr:hypothetical protein FPQ18DRAFT_169340 [Pyronema domesticum]